MDDDTCCGCNKETRLIKSKQEGQEDTYALGTKGYISEFLVPKMDCPSEEQMIRMAFDQNRQRVSLEFDIPNRQVRVFHSNSVKEIETSMKALGLGASLKSSCEIDGDKLSQAHLSASHSESNDAKVLKVLLGINAFMFALELSVGWLAQSTGLIADSLDMFADAAVYGLALYAVGHGDRMKLRTAHISGWLQMILAFGALLEVGRRFWFGSEPESLFMMSFGLVALAANVLCLSLIAKNKDGGAHMKASWIFSANDVIANSGVILAGVLVAWTGSRYPDLIVGLIIALVVLNGAKRILQLKA